MEHKRVPAIVTKIEEDQGIVEHAVAVMGNIDAVLDIIRPGAFTKTITERMSKIRVLDSHRTDSISSAIGKPMAMWEVGRDELPMAVLAKCPRAQGALMARTKFLLDVPEGKGAFLRIKEGLVDEYSIGYDALDTDYSEEKDENGDKVRIRNLRTCKLYEYSPVIFGANSATATVSAKSKDATSRIEQAFRFWQPGTPEVKIDSETISSHSDDSVQWYKFVDKGDSIEFIPIQEVEMDETKEVESPDVEQPEPADDKAVNGAANLPIAGRDREWDASAAERRVRSWADAEDEPNAKYRRAFFWYDGDASENFTSYKLQFADVIDGELQAIPRGLFAVAGVLQGARGGVDIPQADQDAIKGRASRYYGRMREQFDDDSIVPPWEKAKEGDEPEEEKVGRAISQARADRLVSAVQRMQELADGIMEMLVEAGAVEVEEPEEEASGHRDRERDKAADVADESKELPETEQAGPSDTTPTSEGPELDIDRILQDINLDILEVKSNELP